MKTAWALVVKYILTFVFAGVTFAFIDGNIWTSTAILAAVATAVNYIIGDLWVLPNLGNLIASVGDGIMGALVAYFMAFFVVGFTVSLTSLILFAILIAVGEFFFHQYLRAEEKVAP